MKEPNSKNFFRVKTKGDRNSKKINHEVVTRIILMACILFFGLQFLSHTFFFLGKSRDENSRFLKLSSQLFPIDAKPLCEYGFALLEKNQKKPDPRVLAKSISYFKRSLNVNMLYYLSHLNLGKAYIYRNMLDHTSYDQALEAFKKAALIRGNNTRVSLDSLSVMVSMWPFLKEKDKAFCTDLLKKSLRKITEEDFNSLMEIWGLYSRDIDFFKDALEKRTDFYLLAAEKLRQLEIDMKARQDFLAKNAAHMIRKIQNLYEKFLEEQPADLLEKLTRLYETLRDQTTAGYYLINRENKQNRRTYFELKKRLNKDILELLFEKKEWKRDVKQRVELDTYILSYIEDLSSMDELKSFEDFLVDEEYFKISAFRVFYIKQLINFKSRRYDTVISDTKKLIESISYVKAEHMKDYSDILLLFTDAYISSGLLVSATDVLKGIKKNDFNLTDIYWRKMQIEEIIGADDEDEKEQQEKKHQYELIINSSRMRLNSPLMGGIVYLIETNEDKNKNERKSIIEIQFSDSLQQQIKTQSFHLLQLFIDGKLFDEFYLSRLKFPAKIPIPIRERFSRHAFRIKIL